MSASSTAALSENLATAFSVQRLRPAAAPSEPFRIEEAEDEPAARPPENPRPLPELQAQQQRDVQRKRADRAENTRQERRDTRAESEEDAPEPQAPEIAAPAKNRKADKTPGTAASRNPEAAPRTPASPVRENADQKQDATPGTRAIVETGITLAELPNETATGKTGPDAPKSAEKDTETTAQTVVGTTPTPAAVLAQAAASQVQVSQVAVASAEQTGNAGTSVENVTGVGSAGTQNGADPAIGAAQQTNAGAVSGETTAKTGSPALLPGAEGSTVSQGNVATPAQHSASEADPKIKAGPERATAGGAREGAPDPAAWGSAAQRADAATSALSDFNAFQNAFTGASASPAGVTLPGAASLPAANGTAPAHAPTAPTPLHAVPVEIGMRAMKGQTDIDIRLDPAELGRVEVKIRIDDAGNVTASLVVDRVETLQLLQRDAKNLERAFDQAGLKSNPDDLTFSLRRDDSRSGHNAEQGHETRGALRPEPDADSTLPPEPAAITVYQNRRWATGLDIKI
jgi:flagellar hook-length control protein FliK